VPFAVDRETYFTQMQCVAGSGAPAAELIGILLAECAAPVAHGFIRQDDAACGHQRFDVPRAEAEAEIQPDAVAHDLCGKAVTLLQVG
jgi:hypothetical protein